MVFDLRGEVAWIDAWQCAVIRYGCWLDLMWVWVCLFVCLMVVGALWLLLLNLLEWLGWGLLLPCFACWLVLVFAVLGLLGFEFIMVWFGYEFSCTVVGVSRLWLAGCVAVGV